MEPARSPRLSLRVQERGALHRSPATGPLRCKYQGCHTDSYNRLGRVPRFTQRKEMTRVRYADAGVDISRADQAKERIRRMAARTFTRDVLGGIGSFGALYALDLKRWKEPVLVSSADGVGTKPNVAAAVRLHSPAGADLVNHCRTG